MSLSFPPIAELDEAKFSAWLALRTWDQLVRLSRVVAVLVPIAALALDSQPIASGLIYTSPLWAWMLGFHVVAEVVCLAVLGVDRYGPSLRGKELTVDTMSTVVVVLSTWIGFTSWHFSGDFSIWALGLVFVATVVCTPSRARKYLYLASAAGICSMVFIHVADWRQVVVALTNPLVVAVVCLQLDKYTLERNRDLFREKELVEFERRRADKVLYNVLPASIADELKTHEKVNAVKFERLGVMFADIVGFTNFSRSLPPEALVLVLNSIFSAFDGLVERRGLEKIKTIGDAYMTVSFKDTSSLAQLAMEMIEVLRQYNVSNGTDFQIRIGMHVGPAVAGVIGVKRFLYDVWGDTVNVASRMEASGEPGKVHVTEAVYQELQTRFSFVRLDPMDVKGKGLMITYHMSPRTPTLPGYETPSPL